MVICYWGNRILNTTISLPSLGTTLKHPEVHWSLLIPLCNMTCQDLLPPKFFMFPLTPSVPLSTGTPWDRSVSCQSLLVSLHLLRPLSPYPNLGKFSLQTSLRFFSSYKSDQKSQAKYHTTDNRMTIKFLSLTKRSSYFNTHLIIQF